MEPGWDDTSPADQIRLVVSWLVVAAFAFVCYVILGLRGWGPPLLAMGVWSVWWANLVWRRS